MIRVFGNNKKSGYSRSINNGEPRPVTLEKEFSNHTYTYSDHYFIDRKTNTDLPLIGIKTVSYQEAMMQLAPRLGKL